MPNGFVIGHDLSDVSRRRVVAALGEGATELTVGDAWVAHVGGDRETLDVETLVDGVRLTYGCDAASPAPSSDHESLLDGVDDGVAALVTPSGTTVSCGRGHHQLFHTTLAGGGTAVGSGLHAVAAARDDLRIDRGHEDFALGFGFHPEGSTPYESVAALPAGHRHRMTGSGITPAGATEPARSDPGELPGSFDAAVERLHELFMAAIERQTGGRRRHAVLLGGLDSALVATCLRRLGHEVDTYTFHFGQPRFEQRNATFLAEVIGAEHHLVRITPEGVMERLHDFALHYPGLGAQPHYQIHTLLGSEQIAADGHVRVFTGDACDSIFLGYPTVSARAALGQRLAVVPTPLASGLRRALASEVLADRLGHVARMARGTLDNLRLEMPARGHLPTRYLDEYELRRLRQGPPPPPQRASVDELRRRLAEPVTHLDPVRLAFHGNGLNRQSQAKVDGAVRATGVAQFSPYRDPSVRDFVTALPTEFLRPPGGDPRAAGKAVLVEMVRRHRLLPDAILDMPKQSPSDSPIDGWYAGVLRSEVHELLFHLPFAVDHAAVDAILRDKRTERWYRERVSLSHHAFQAIGLLCSYASFGVVAGA